MIAFTAQFDFRIPYTSIHGTFDCPLPVEGDEGFIMVSLGSAMYGGTYGGENGKIALPGDITFYGHYMLDVSC